MSFAAGSSAVFASCSHKVPDQFGVTAGVDDGDNHRAIRLLKVIDRKVTFGDQGPVVVVEFYRKAPRIERDSIRGSKVALEESVPPATQTGGKVIIGELHILADIRQGDNWLAGHLWRLIDFFSSSIVSVAIWPWA